MDTSETAKTAGLSCKDCRYFSPRYYQLGACKRQCSPNAKMFTDDDKAGILVHASFGCVQFEPPTETAVETL